MFGADFFADAVHHQIQHPDLAALAALIVRLTGWLFATLLLNLAFAVIFYWAPDLHTRRWRWLTPGSLFGILGWLLASLGLRVYLHFFNTYALTYGSLGAVIILLTWFYLTGLMILLGAEINSEIEAAVAERTLPPPKSTPPATRN
jgi:membrane protein